MSNRVFGMSVHEDLQKFTKFYPFLGHPLIFTNLNTHSRKMLPTKFDSNQFSGFGEEVI